MKRIRKYWNLLLSSQWAKNTLMVCEYPLLISAAARNLYENSSASRKHAYCIARHVNDWKWGFYLVHFLSEVKYAAAIFKPITQQELEETLMSAISGCKGGLENISEDKMCSSIYWNVLLNKRLSLFYFFRFVRTMCNLASLHKKQDAKDDKFRLDPSSIKSIHFF